MKGIVVLAHGSRIPQTKDTMRAVLEMVKKKLPEMPIVIAYMEFCEENIENGVKTLVEQGVTEIKVVPYFLFAGIHIKEDIPNEFKKVLEKYEGVTVEMGSTLGVDERLADILADRIMG